MAKTKGRKRSSPSPRKKGKKTPKTSPLRQRKQPVVRTSKKTRRATPVAQRSEFIHLGRKRKTYKEKLTKPQVEALKEESALRDYVRNERANFVGRSKLTYEQARTEPEFKKAMKALRALKGRRTKEVLERATTALKTLGRLRPDAPPIYIKFLRR